MKLAALTLPLVLLAGCPEESCAPVAELPPEQITPTPGNCESYAPLFEKYGLPVQTFMHIAWRESGCNHLSFVKDSDDLGGGLLGINLRAGASGWYNWCGLTVNNVTDADKNVECAKAAYDRLGMRPWS